MSKSYSSFSISSKTFLFLFPNKIVIALFFEISLSRYSSNSSVSVSSRLLSLSPFHLIFVFLSLELCSYCSTCCSTYGPTCRFLSCFRCCIRFFYDGEYISMFVCCIHNWQYWKAVRCGSGTSRTDRCGVSSVIVMRTALNGVTQC